MNTERERCWLAAYTRSSHESHVAGQLAIKGVEALLPTYTKLKRYHILAPSGRKGPHSQRVPLFETTEAEMS
jgi:hypothetical protein